MHREYKLVTSGFELEATGYNPGLVVSDTTVRACGEVVPRSSVNNAKMQSGNQRQRYNCVS